MSRHGTLLRAPLLALTLIVAGCEGSIVDTPRGIPPKPDEAVVPLPVGAPVLTATLDAPQRAGVGQQLSVRLVVRNSGDADALDVTATAPKLSGVGAADALGQVPAPVAVLAAGESATFVFRYSATGAGPLIIEASGSARDAASPAAITFGPVSATVLVELPPELTITGLTAPSQAEVGDEVTLTMTVANSGEAAADEVAPDALVQSGSGSATLVSGPLPARAVIAAGQSQSFRWTYRIATPGTLTFTGAAAGLDVHTRTPVTASPVSSPAVELHTPAVLELQLSAPTTVTAGQSYSATLVVRNTGTALATMVGPDVAVPMATTASGNATATTTSPAAMPVDLPGGASVSFVWTYVAAGTGSLSLSVGARGLRASGAQVTAAAATANTNVVAAGMLNITSLTSPGTVQRGQTFTVSMTVRNSGGSTLAGVLPSPLRPTTTATGGAAATTTSTPTAQMLAPGASTTFTWSFVESGTAAGSLTFNAGATATDGASGPVVTAPATQSNLTVVVAPAALVIETVTVPVRVSRGQTFNVAVTVRNSGGAPASGVLPTVTPMGTGGPNASTATMQTAVNLAPGARQTFTYSFTENGTAAGTLRFTATASAGTVTAPAVTSNAITVDAPARLQITSITLPAVVERGQSFVLSVTIANQGQASASGVLPQPSPPTRATTGAAAATTTATVTAATIAGGANRTFNWLYTENGTGTGTLSFSTGATGTDVNTGLTVTAMAQTSNTATVAAPCDPALYPGLTLAQVQSEFATQVYPLLTRTTSAGCVNCHAAANQRLFTVSASAADTFASARAAGLLTEAPSAILTRLKSTDTAIRMPKNLPAWPAAEVAAVAGVVCKLKAYEASPAGPPAAAPTPRLYRLTHTQWTLAVQDLLELATPPTGAAGFRPDPVQGGYLFDNNALAMAVDSSLWESYRVEAEAIAAQVAADSAKVLALAPTVNGTTDDRARAFITNFGKKAHRRPLTTTEVNEYFSVYRVGAAVDAGPDNFVNGFRLLVQAFLQSPRFLNRVETSTTQTGSTIPLDNYELASKLSFTLWNSSPDSTLMAAAESGALQNPMQLRAQVDRLLAHPRAEETVKRFHDLLLDVSKYDGVTPATGVYSGSAAQLRTSLRRETELFVRNLWTSNQGVTQLLSSNQTFVDSTLAPLYGLSGTYSSTFVPVTLNSSQRRGVLTQLGFLALNATSSDPDPIHRGVFLSRRIVCNFIAAPPGNIPPLPPLMPNSTNRQRVEAHTEAAGSVCASCHGQSINPFGFPFEQYDAVGRHRTTDNGLPVNPASTVWIDGAPLPVQDGPQLALALSTSRSVHRCYGRHLSAWALGRPTMLEDENTERWLGAQSQTGVSLRELLARLVTSPAFTARSLQELP